MTHNRRWRWVRTLPFNGRRHNIPCSFNWRFTVLRWICLPWRPITFADVETDVQNPVAQITLSNEDILMPRCYAWLATSRTVLDTSFGLMLPQQSWYCRLVQNEASCDDALVQPNVNKTKNCIPLLLRQPRHFSQRLELRQTLDIVTEMVKGRNNEQWSIS